LTRKAKCTSENGKKFMKNFQQLKLPAFFMPVVSAVSGTSDYRLPSLGWRHRIANVII
jgi:hypothetical protein